MELEQAGSDLQENSNQMGDQCLLIALTNEMGW